jgi:hypothetical protein
MKQRIVQALEAHVHGHIEKHKMNIHVMLENPIAIHDHTDLMSAIENELQQLVEYQDKLNALIEHFGERRLTR